MRKVLIPTKLESVARETLKAKGFAVVQDADTPIDKLAAAHPDTEALVVRSEKVTPAVIDSLPDLKVVVRAGAGYDTIDFRHARKKGVDVMNTPGANANAVAEEVVALILAHLRFIVPGDQTTRAGKWEKKSYMGRELSEKTVGVVGLGNIGQLVVKRMSGFDVKFLGYDPVVSPDRAREMGVETVSLPELFQRSDFVTLHIPETAETKGMVNKSLLSLMKPGAVLVNCARAGVVVEEDLRQVKQEKKMGFLNDVYAKDEAGPKSCADIADIMVPHLGANTVEANTNAARRAAEQLIAYFERGVTKYVVNKGVPDGLDESYQHLAYLVAFVGRRLLGADRSVNRVECSFCGGLHDFAKWFTSPVVAAVSNDFDAASDPQEAADYLAKKGVSFEVRAPDGDKGYGKAIAIDLFEGRDVIRKVSLRGTITEGKPLIARVNDFDNVYFQPAGNCLMVIYQDRPGVLAKITSAVAEAGINIDDIRAQLEPSAKRALAVLKTNRLLPEDAVARIRREVNADVAVAMALP
ncbi:MAG: D-3-phosphoglycerate dehydrogenase [Lentisphaerae bacterium ADurb.BinA184]|nr:MAG: D-3-phosphoglycerate dehydrogenase [Lentisphaerae bacterium ADurb.BinA184]